MAAIDERIPMLWEVAVLFKREPASLRELMVRYRRN